MDFLQSFKVFLVVLSLVIDLSFSIAWYKDVGQGDMLNSFNSPYLSPAFDRFYGEREKLPKSVSKRSADWSNRRFASSVSPSKLLPEPQESENIEITTQLPKVIRKVRLQNVPQQFKRFDENGISIDQSNGSVTSNKRGRVVRVKKFRKRTTTAKPVVSTETGTMPATTRYTTLRPINFIRQTTFRPSKSTLDYSHITVVNKEHMHQKPNRKNRNKNMNRIWVPTSTFGSRSVQKESNDVTSRPYPTESEIKRQRSEISYDDYQNKNKGFGTYDLSPDLNQRSRSNRQITNSENGSKLEKERLNEHLNTRRTMTENKQKTHVQASIRQSSPSGGAEEMKEKNSHSTDSPSSLFDTTPMPTVPKSVEILRDEPHNQNNPLSSNIPQSMLKSNDSHFIGMQEGALMPFGSEITTQPQGNSQPKQRFPETQFGQFPTQGGSVFQGFPYENINPYFRTPQSQIPRMPSMQANNPLIPTNFQQPFNPFHRQNDPQFQNYFSSPFQPSPYHRRDGLARPDFYQSPQLASLRRSIIEEAYSDEVTEPTTEFSIPKFEVPSIDFNDKGCRTVYKEVRAVPTDELNGGTQEGNAKSFVLTRECYFPDGVPTVKPVEEKEITESTTSHTKEI